jgi:hypothetical protein
MDHMNAGDLKITRNRGKVHFNASDDFARLIYYAVVTYKEAMLKDLRAGNRKDPRFGVEDEVFLSTQASFAAMLQYEMEQTVGDAMSLSAGWRPPCHLSIEDLDLIMGFLQVPEDITMEQGDLMDRIRAMQKRQS